MRAADQNFRAVDFRLHAATGGFGKIFRLGQRNSGFARERGERLGGRMVAVFFGGRGEQQKFGGLRFANRREAADGELAGRERAGFVENEGIYFCGEFDVGDVLDQNSQTRGGGQRGDHRGRRRENERARTGHDEHGDDAVKMVRERPDERADDEHERRIKAHVLIHDFLDRQFGLFRRDDEFAHAAERRVFAGAADFDFQNAGQILRAGENFVAGFFIGGQRFTGNGGLVERTLAAHDDAVRRDVVAGADADDIADGKFAGGDFLFAAGFCQPPRLRRRELDERLDGIARALGGAGLDDFAGEHEKRDDAGGLVIARRERREHGDGDQFVDAQPAAPQILDGGDDDGIAEDDRADHGAGAGERAAGLEQPVHEIGVEDEDDAEDGLPEMHDGMFVVVAAAALRPVLMFVLA